MHELSIAQALVEQLQDHVRQHRARGIGRVVVRIGPLAGVVPELLASAFPMAAAGTVAEAAVLELEDLPVRVRCRICGAETEAAPNRLRCGTCGDWQTTLISGDELLLASLELIDTEDMETQRP